MDIKHIGRGTTPLHEFTIPSELALSDQITALHIIYKQYGLIKLCKKLEDVNIEGNVISVRLTQEDTFLFHCSGDVEIQLRIKFLNNDDVVNSDVMVATVDECLEDEVI